MATNAKKFRNLDAPGAIVDVVRSGLCMPFDQALVVEREAYLKLREGPQSKALRHVFSSEREAAKIPGLSANTRPLPIESVGIIGSGTMGTGISVNFLLAGISVTLVETSGVALERGRGAIAKIVARDVETGRLKVEQAERALALLTPSLSYDDLSKADLIIEAAFETMPVKQDIFRRLDQVAKPDAILATNTSYLDVDVIAGETSRPQQVIGLHFFSPANIMKLLEIVKAAKTDDSVLVSALALAKKIGKTPVVAGVAYGFIGNRLLAIRRREAEQMILEGASLYLIDAVLEEFGMPMGPFRMGDLAGLDLGWTRESSRGSTVRERLCELGRRGQKTSAGFYDYDSGGKATTSKQVEDVIRDFAREKNIEQRSFTNEELIVRLLYPMINEGAKILEEGKAYRASDIDVAWINGFGWPAWRGGPMFYADSIGLEKIRSHLNVLTAQFGQRFMPTTLLSKLAAQDSSFAAFDEERRSLRA